MEKPALSLRCMVSWTPDLR